MTFNGDGTFNLAPSSTINSGSVCDGCFKACRDSIVKANDAAMGKGWSASYRGVSERIVYDGYGRIIRRDGVLEFGGLTLTELKP